VIITERHMRGIFFACMQNGEHTKEINNGGTSTGQV
jgi:hypothetical protein